MQLLGDALIDLSLNTTSYEVGLSLDALKIFLNKYEDRLDLKVYVSHLDPRLANRRKTVSAFYTYGTRLTAQVGGKIDKAGDKKWYFREAIGEKN